MHCAQDLCLRVEKVFFQTPPHKIEIAAKDAVAICVKPDAVTHWLQLAQALYYAYHWKGPAKNPNISALLFLTQKDQIKDALAASAAGSTEAICAALAPRDARAKIEMARGAAPAPPRANAPRPRPPG
ncbi:MAG: hypothetical protein JHC20_00705, partial [Pyrobaculum sp.]|nr:hypothetical protein [Pyrobaculum sp.]